uniref:Transposase n=1 Tax=Agrobacterium tumefaciens TaxID=358 RepID=A0A2Z2PYN0_AGRTU|nr:hypothetical protein [Agrobacterium radiobacter]
MSNEFRQVDLMIGDVRRRRWTTERKLQIIEESCAAGETVSSAARRHGVAPNLRNPSTLSAEDGLPKGVHQSIVSIADLPGETGGTPISAEC